MANSKIDVKAKTSSVKNDKTKKQDEEYEDLKKQKEEAKKKAKENQEKAKKEAEEKQAEKEKQEAEEKKKQENNDKIVDFANDAIDSLSKSKKSNSFKNTLITLIIGMIIGFLLAVFFGFSGVSEEKEVISSNEIEETILSHTDVDLKDVILGEAIQHQELIVMENPLEISTTITKSGLGGLSIFSKIKDITYHGRGLYTVDMSKIDKDHISVDEENKVVKVLIPHTVLQEVILDVNDIEFEDTENGLLAFGDLSLTSEQQNLVEVTVRQSMEEALNNKELFEKADEFAKLKTWQIFQPLISAVSNEYIVEMEIK